MKQFSLRIFGSTIGAFVITICLFLLMIVLIQVDYKPVEKKRTRQYKQIESLDTEFFIEREIKLKPKLKKAEQAPPAPDKTTHYARELPTITPINKTIQAITNPLKPESLSKQSPSIPSASELLENTAFQSRSHGGENSTSGQGTKGKSGRGNGAGGLTQCSISFTLVGTRNIKELTWLNCIDAKIAKEAEKALYAWITQQDSDFSTLNAKPGDRLEFTFQRR